MGVDGTSWKVNQILFYLVHLFIERCIIRQRGTFYFVYIWCNCDKSSDACMPSPRSCCPLVLLSIGRSLECLYSTVWRRQLPRLITRGDEGESCCLAVGADGFVFTLIVSSTLLLYTLCDGQSLLQVTVGTRYQRSVRLRKTSFASLPWDQISKKVNIWTNVTFR